MFARSLLAFLIYLSSLFETIQGYNLGADDSCRKRSDFGEQHVPATDRGSWLGWGANVYNNRLAASDAIVDVSNVASLDSICKEVYPIGESAPPLVVNGVAYYPTWNGLLVALEYSGCRVLWQRNVTELGLQHGPISNLTGTLNQLRSRTTPALYKDTLFIGALANALLLAIDRRNGTLLDTYQISTHPLAILTMSPTVWRGMIFIGSSSNEEYGSAIIPGYKCCSFIGVMNGLAFENNRFELLWSKPMIPIGSNFAGSAIWGSQPSIDPNVIKYLLPRETYMQSQPHTTLVPTRLQTLLLSIPAMPPTLVHRKMYTRRPFSHLIPRQACSTGLIDCLLLMLGMRHAFKVSLAAA